MAPDGPVTAASILADTVEILSHRAPAIVAAAARHLGGLALGLQFGDGSASTMTARHSRLLVVAELAAVIDVAVHFDDRAMNLVFDLQRHPVDQLLPESLDVRGERSEVLAVWRVFQLLAQRASGLRAVQDLWRDYRVRAPQLWGELPAESRPVVPQLGPPRVSGWRALDYLEARHPDVPNGQRATVGGTVTMQPRVLWDGRASSSWWSQSVTWDADLRDVMASCRDRVGAEMQALVPQREPRAQLYDLMRDYPSRAGKGLRPTLALATCVAFGGRAEDAVRTAAAMELFHNGFLVHDDISDESTHRRGRPTLHVSHGIGLAVNAGDGLNLLAVDAVLSNLPSLGLARTLGLINEILHMCRETIEGQAVELGWIHDVVVPPDDDDYFTMSTKKTGWYTCITPCRVGAICAGVTDPAVLARFDETFRLVGIAFQIQDDVLNLIGEEALYGKEPLGDLLEGKRTVMLIDVMRRVRGAEARRLGEIIAMRRTDKTQTDAEEILASMHRHGSIDYAIAVADRLAHQGIERFEQDLDFLPQSEAKGVLRQIANYVTTRPL